MNKFKFTLIAVSGLALSFVACAPAHKGMGTTLPNLQAEFREAAKTRSKLVEENAHIDKITKGDETSNGKIKMTVKLKKTDLQEGEDTKEVEVLKDGNSPSRIIFTGNGVEYIVELACSKNNDCAMAAAMLTEATAEQQLELPLPQNNRQPQQASDEDLTALEQNSGEQDSSTSNQSVVTQAVQAGVQVASAAVAAGAQSQSQSQGEQQAASSEQQNDQTREISQANIRRKSIIAVSFSEGAEGKKVWAQEIEKTKNFQEALNEITPHVERGIELGLN